MIALFTDFGFEGPYLGQMKAVLLGQAPGVPVLDLMADAPACDPRRAAYLLAAFAAELPEGTVNLCVVDPGVGTARRPMVAEIDGRLYVGPDNGLFEPLLRRGATVATWEIAWRPERLSASFHGRDLFAPVAARLACGLRPEAVGCRPFAPGRKDWPDDLAEVVYVDRYGNAMTGLRGELVAPIAEIEAGGRSFRYARTFAEAPPGGGFWYENSSGLVEIAVNGGPAGLAVGTPILLRQ